MRYAILSDIHANADALEAVLDQLEPTMPIWFLGDAVGYYADAVEVLDKLTLLHTSGRLTYWLKGNHDYAAHAYSLIDVDMSAAALAAIQRTRADLTSSERELLENLSAGPQLVTDEPGIALVHGGPDKPLTHYMEDIHDAADATHVCPAPLCLIGHTHVPLKLFSDNPTQRSSWRRQALFQAAQGEYRYGEAMVFLNPGSVGQPRDGQRFGDDAHASYAILDTERRTFTIAQATYDPEPLFVRTRDWLRDTLPPEDVERLLLRLLHAD